MKQELTVERLKELLHYDPETGVFTWIAKTNRRIVLGMPAGTVVNGYIRIKVGDRIHSAARLAHLYMNGRWPDGDVDHRDGMPLNNKWTNLRDVSTSENIQNQRHPSKRNRTGYLGVGPAKNGLFRARIYVHGKEHSLGFHKTPEGAHMAYVAAKRILHAGGLL